MDLTLCHPFCSAPTTTGFPVAFLPIQASVDQRLGHRPTPIPNAALQGPQLPLGELAGIPLPGDPRGTSPASGSSWSHNRISGHTFSKGSFRVRHDGRLRRAPMRRTSFPFTPQLGQPRQELLDALSLLAMTQFPRTQRRQGRLTVADTVQQLQRVEGRVRYRASLAASETAVWPRDARKE